MTKVEKLFKELNLELFGREVFGTAKKAKKFEELQDYLIVNEIDITDYVLSAFSDNAYLAEKVGYLPLNCFLGMKTKEKYKKRQESFTTRNDMEEDSGGEGGIEDWLFLHFEMNVGSAIVAAVQQGVELDDDDIEREAGVPAGYLKWPNRPIKESEDILYYVFQTPPGDYQKIGQERLRRERIRRSRQQRRQHISI